MPEPDPLTISCPAFPGMAPSVLLQIAILKPEDFRVINTADATIDAKCTALINLAPLMPISEAINRMEPLRLQLSGEIDAASVERAVDPSEERTAADEHYESMLVLLESMDELLEAYREKLRASK